MRLRPGSNPPEGDRDGIPPPRLLMTTDTVGGVWTYALDLAQGLSERGTEVCLATLGRPLSRDQRQAIPRLSRVEVRESTYRLEWMQDPWRDILESGEWLLQLEDEFQPDLIHLNQYSYGQLPWKCPRIVVAHSDVFSWWLAVHGSEPPSDWDRYRSEVTNGLQAADLVIAPSQAMAESLRALYGPISELKVIPNGRDLSAFEHGVQRNSQRLPKESFILTIGRLWDEAKNVRILDEIADRLPWPVWVAGSTRNPARSRDESGLRPRSVRLLGELSAEQIRHYLSRAAIYALPALYEPFGLSVLEAAASGCALVLGDIPSLRENWGNAAFFADPRDPEALVEALLSCIRDSHARAARAQAARERSQFYSLKRMSSSYWQEYLRLARTRTGSRLLPAPAELPLRKA